MDCQFKKLYFVFLFIFIFLLLNLNFVCADELEKEVTFLAFGHVYANYDALELSIGLIEKENPDFIVFLGDSTADQSGKSWSDLEPIINKIKYPIYFAPGNHDIADGDNNKEYFLTNISEHLYQEFEVNNNIFIILNTVLEKEYYGDISEEQFSFIKSVYNENDGDIIIFIHHCLFYEDNGQLCNYRGDSISKDSNWNSGVVPFIKNKTLAVFSGDSGFNEPYFSYKENDIHYFGVGFGTNNIKFPPHMLKVTVSKESFIVTPIPLEQNLAEINYQIEEDKINYFNLKFIILFFIIIILSGTILFLLIKLRDMKLFLRVRESLNLP